MLAGDQPHDVADFALAVVAREPCERVAADPLFAGQFGRVGQRRALGIAEQRARSVLGKSIETCRVVRRFLPGVPPGGVHAEQAGVDAGHLLTDEYGGL